MLFICFLSFFFCFTDDDNRAFGHRILYESSKGRGRRTAGLEWRRSWFHGTHSSYSCSLENRRKSFSLSLSLTTRTVAPNPPMQCRITSTEAPLYGVFTWLYLETYWCIRGPVQFPYGKGPDVIRVGLSSLYNFYFYFRKKKKIFSFLVSSWRVALNLKRKAEARPTPPDSHTSITFRFFLSLSATTTTTTRPCAESALFASVATKSVGRASARRSRSDRRSGSRTGSDGRLGSRKATTRHRAAKTRTLARFGPNSRKTFPSQRTTNKHIKPKRGAPRVV